VKNAYRPGQRCAIVPLAEVVVESADMFTLLILGNSTSRVVPGRGSNPLAWENGARMLTPRGYEQKHSGLLDRAMGKG
jgi:precorrin-3B methylase